MSETTAMTGASTTDGRDLVHLTMPKKAFREERRMYYMWKFAFFRELLQNATDTGVGASRISIEIKERPEGGCIVVFDDNGKGMTEEVLRKVYFRYGATSKTGGSTVGGFGRARVLTCFGADHFEITTNDVVAAAVHQVDDEGEELGGLFSIRKAESRHKGCRLTIELHDTDWESMARELQAVLGMSQIKPEVTILTPAMQQPVVWKQWTNRGRKTGTLSAEDDNGQRHDFAEVWVNKSAPQSMRNRLMVRVNGSVMFHSYTEVDAQVVIELDTPRSREILDMSRSSLQGNYRYALEDFMSRLAKDSQTALREIEAPREYVKSGGLGTFSSSRPGTEPVVAKAAGEAADVRLPTMEAVAGSNSPDLGVGVPESAAAKDAYRADYAPLGKAAAEEDATADLVNPELPDLYVIEEGPKGRQKTGMRNFMRGWDGEGNSKSKQLVKAFEVACRACIDALYVSDPYGLPDSINWTLGVLFQSETAERLRGVHKELPDGTHVLAFNPLDETGKLAFSLNRVGLNHLLSVAKHESTHIKVPHHGERFIIAREGLDSELMDGVVLRDMEKAIAEIRTVLRGGPEIETIDDTPGAIADAGLEGEPMDHLLAAVYPNATAAAGISFAGAEVAHQRQIVVTEERPVGAVAAVVASAVTSVPAAGAQNAVQADKPKAFSIFDSNWPPPQKPVPRTNRVVNGQLLEAVEEMVLAPVPSPKVERSGDAEVIAP